MFMYRLRMANLFQPFWSVTENIFNFKQISSLGRATFYGRGEKSVRGRVRRTAERGSVLHVLEWLASDVKNTTGLPYKIHLVCGVSEVTSPFSLL